MPDKQDTLQRAYAQLRALKENLPNIHVNNHMDWPQVRLYEELLNKLEQVGLSMLDFRIPPNLLQSEQVVVNYLTHETVDSGQPQVTEAFFQTKLDALLIYFQLGDGDAEDTRVLIKL